MKFSCDYYDQLPSAYKEAVRRLLHHVKRSSKYKIQRNLFENFYRDYTMIPDLGIYWKRIERQFLLSHINQRSKIDQRLDARRRQLFKHFYWEDDTISHWRNFMEHRPKIFTFFKTMNVPQIIELRCRLLSQCGINYEILQKSLKLLLTFPHSKMDQAMELYIEYGASPLSKALFERYQKCCKLYEKIVAVENDMEQWVLRLIEVDDEEFVIQNVEHRLGKNPCNKELWHLYFKFLNTKNDKIGILF